MQYRILVLGLCTILAGFALWGGPITGVNIEGVSAEFTASGWDLRAVNVVNGSGLTGTPAEHAVIAYPGGNSWQTDTMSGTGWISFDLGAEYDLARLHIWNLNFYGPYNGRGAKDVDIYTSLNGIDWTNEGRYLFLMATGLDGDPGFDVAAGTWSTARYVRLNILSNFGSFDNAGHVGLSEVQFFADEGAAIPEPGTIWLVLAGVTALAASRRRRSA
jgi:hypothetical protein